MRTGVGGVRASPDGCPVRSVCAPGRAGTGRPQPRSSPHVRGTGLVAYRARPANESDSHVDSP